MSIHKTIVIVAALTVAVSVGSVMGMHVSADSLTLPTVIEPRTTDARHPVEIYWAPAFATSTSAVLAQAGVQLAPQDRVSTIADPSLGLGGQVVVARAQLVTLKDGATTTPVRTWANTVQDFITEQNIELGDKDRVDPPLAATLAVNQTITITRVAVVDVTKDEAIPFVTKTQDDPTRPKGEQKILQAGVAGSKKLTYQVTRENGVEVGRKLVKTDIVSQPVNEIISVGTKPVITGWCAYNDWVTDAAIKNGIDPDGLCYRMHKESNGHANSDGGRYKGLFQYEPGLWTSVSAQAGYPGASIWDPKSQIYVTAWAWAHGYRGRWPNP